MNTSIARVALLFVCLQGSCVFGAIEPRVVPQGSETYEPLYYTGAIESDIPSGDGTTSTAFASGAVAGHPRMVLSCAHLNYTKGIGWHGAGSTRWFLHWNQSGAPSRFGASGMTLSGFYRFDGYATFTEADRKADAPSNKTFAKDYAVHYHVSQNTGNGYFAPLWQSGTEFLTKSSSMKKISGYPSEQYYTGDFREYRMHETVPFANRATVTSGPYLTINLVTTYGGNSGGPIWGWVNGRWVHTGVVVSSDRRFSFGVVANHPSGMSLIISALRDQFSDSLVYQNSFSASAAGAIPDAGTLTRTFTVANMLGGVQSIKLNLDIKHPRRGDLLITLRSPQNRTLTIWKSVAVKNSSPANLSAILNVNGFSSADPNGTWTLTIKDVYKTRAGTLLAAGMDITTR